MRCEVCHAENCRVNALVAAWEDRAEQMRTAPPVPSLTKEQIARLQYWMNRKWWEKARDWLIGVR